MKPPKDQKAERLLDDLDTRCLEQDRVIYDMEGYDAGAETNEEDGG